LGIYPLKQLLTTATKKAFREGLPRIVKAMIDTVKEVTIKNMNDSQADLFKKSIYSNKAVRYAYSNRVIALSYSHRI